MAKKRLWRSLTIGVIVLLLLQFGLIGVSSAAPSASYGAIYHVVQPGENLTMIAWRYGTTPYAIAQLNGIWNMNLIYAGQVLLIYPGPYPHPPGPWPPPPPWPPHPYPKVYIVRPGDTLYSIAWRFGTTVWAIAYINHIPNPNLIYVGQRLRIPGP